jgi:RecB family exonuclease
MTINPDFVFSANNLQDYQDCPRRFELKYLLKQRWPAEESEPVLEWEHELELGTRFHQLVYQYLSGLPEEALLESINDPDVESWFRIFLAFYSQQEFSQTFPEFRVRVPLGDYQAVAVYDLLALTPDNRLLILDWKTAKKKPQRSKVSDRMQTVLYPFAALESAHNFLPDISLSPESIEMTYVYVRQALENTLTFNYDAQKHAENRSNLETLAAEIAALELGDFPLTDDKRRCKYCVYRSLCERGENAGSLSDIEGMETEPELDLDALLGSLDFEAGDEIAF